MYEVMSPFTTSFAFSRFAAESREVPALRLANLAAEAGVVE